MADFTKSQGQILDWTLLDDTGSNNPFAQATMQTKSTELEVELHIVVAHQDTNDATTNYVTVSVIGRAGGDAEGWREIVSVQSGGGQAIAETLAAASGASQGSPERLEVADTTDWDTGAAQWLFLLDSGTLVDSCLCLIEGWVDADYYINSWDIVRDYDNADILHDGVSQHRVRVPAGIQYFDILFHNADATATYAVRVDYSEVQSIA